MPKESFIQQYQYQHIQQLAEERKKDLSTGHFKCSDYKPGEDGFYRFESAKTLLRKWQKNPEAGSECYTLDEYLTVRKIIADPKFRSFYQAYRCYNIYLTKGHAQLAQERILEFSEKLTYELYGNTQQLDMFEDGMQLISQK